MRNRDFSTDRIHHRGSSLVYHLSALIAVTAWGIAFINTKVLLQHGLGAVEIYVYRFLIAYLCVFLVCPKPLFSNSWRDELKLFLCGVCGNSIYFIAENTALNYTLVTNVSLIVTTSPILTALLVALMYRNDRPSKGFMTGSAIAFAGVACVIFNAVYNVWFITRKTFFYGLLTSLPFLAVEPQLAPLSTVFSPVVIGNLCFLAVICSVVAYVLWAFAVKRIGVMKSGNYLYVSPIVTLVASVLYLGENVSVVGYVGCALIMVGVVLSEKLSRPRK